MSRVVSALTIVQRFYDEIWNQGNLDLIAELCDPQMTFRGSLGASIQGQRGFANYVQMVRGALDRYSCQLQDTVVENNRVFARMRFSGIHRDEFLGYPATEKHVEWVGAALFTIDTDRITDLWVLGDIYGLRQLLDRQLAESSSRHTK